MSVATVTKAFCRALFSPHMQSGKAWLVCNVQGMHWQLFEDAIDTAHDTLPTDTTEDTAKRLFLRNVLRSKVHFSGQGAHAPILGYMGAGGTRMILSGAQLGQAVRYSQE